MFDQKRTRVLTTRLAPFDAIHLGRHLLASIAFLSLNFFVASFALQIAPIESAFAQSVGGGPIIFDVRRSLPLEPNEPVYHDFYLNAGPEAGFRKGMYVSVVRAIPVHDPIQNKQQATLNISIGRLQIIHVEKGITVGRLHSELGNDERPTVEFEAIMIGDRVDLASLTTQAPQKKTLKSPPQPQPVPQPAAPAMAQPAPPAMAQVEPTQPTQPTTAQAAALFEAEPSAASVAGPQVSPQAPAALPASLAPKAIETEAAPQKRHPPSARFEFAPPDMILASEEPEVLEPVEQVETVETLETPKNTFPAPKVTDMVRVAMPSGAFDY